MSEEKGFQVEHHDDVTVVQLKSSYEDGAACPWAAPLEEFISERKPEKVLVDFEHVTRFPSQGIESLLRVDSRVRDYGGQIRLCGMLRAVRDVFKIADLDGRVFRILDSFRSAKKSFDKRTSHRKARKHVKFSRHSFGGTGPADDATAQEIDGYAPPSPGEGPGEPDADFRRAGIRKED